jgi:hypothetical protein
MTGTHTLGQQSTPGSIQDEREKEKGKGEKGRVDEAGLRKDWKRFTKSAIFYHIITPVCLVADIRNFQTKQ